MRFAIYDLRFRQGKAAALPANPRSRFSALLSAARILGTSAATSQSGSNEKQSPEIPSGVEVLTSLPHHVSRFTLHAPRSKAFTLLELLVVLGIIGMLAALGLPALKGIGQSNTMGAANRQLLDDLSFARLQAINGRTTVYVLFVPANPLNQLSKFTHPNQARERKLLTNLVSGQFTAYALYAARSVGDQPGRQYPRYISNWRYLPSGVFIATNKFYRVQTVKNVSLSQWASTDVTIKPFSYPEPKENWFPFPTARSPRYALPYIAFNSQGQLVPRPNAAPQDEKDEIIPLARGSIFYPKDAQGAYLNQPADVQEDPPGNSFDPSTYDFIYLNWLTGRARIEKKVIQ